MLLSPEMDDLSSYLKNKLEDLRVPAGIEINLRQSSVNQEIMLVFKGGGSSGIDFAKILNHQELASIYSLEGSKPRLHYGDASLPERIHAIDMEVSPLAFFQVNHIQSEKMIEIIKEYAQLKSNYTVLDAYCGTGSIALAVAGSVLRVVGVENNKAACKNAKRNAYTNSISNCEFRSGDCEKIIPSIEQPFDIVILDPPRDGCKRELIENIIQKSPKRIVYVSCNPATLARDLALFVTVGYTVDSVQSIDMFPQTGHIETVVRLERKHS
jgi:23S rRNA (uracil1939-C5)-methyltransferase